MKESKIDGFTNTNNHFSQADILEDVNVKTDEFKEKIHKVDSVDLLIYLILLTVGQFNYQSERLENWRIKRVKEWEFERVSESLREWKIERVKRRNSKILNEKGLGSKWQINISINKTTDQYIYVYYISYADIWS